MGWTGLIRIFGYLIVPKCKQAFREVCLPSLLLSEPLFPIPLLWRPVKYKSFQLFSLSIRGGVRLPPTARERKGRDFWQKTAEGAMSCQHRAALPPFPWLVVWLVSLGVSPCWAGYGGGGGLTEILYVKETWINCAMLSLSSEMSWFSKSGFIPHSFTCTSEWPLASHSFVKTIL